MDAGLQHGPVAASTASLAMSLVHAHVACFLAPLLALGSAAGYQARGPPLG